MGDENDKNTTATRLFGTMIEQYGAITLIPITRDNIHTLKPGEWIWDDKLIERREHKLSLTPETITEPIGFRQIHILDLKYFNTIFSNKPFMLSDIDSHNSGYRWVYFEDNRFYMLERKD